MFVRNNIQVFRAVNKLQPAPTAALKTRFYGKQELSEVWPIKKFDQILRLVYLLFDQILPNLNKETFLSKDCILFLYWTLMHWAVWHKQMKQMTFQGLNQANCWSLATVCWGSSQRCFQSINAVVHVYYLCVKGPQTACFTRGGALWTKWDLMGLLDTIITVIVTGVS